MGRVCRVVLHVEATNQTQNTYRRGDNAYTVTIRILQIQRHSDKHNILFQQQNPLRTENPATPQLDLPKTLFKNIQRWVHEPLEKRNHIHKHKQPKKSKHVQKPPGFNRFNTTQTTRNQPQPSETKEQKTPSLGSSWATWGAAFTRPAAKTHILKCWSPEWTCWDQTENVCFCFRTPNINQKVSVSYFFGGIFMKQKIHENPTFKLRIKFLGVFSFLCFLTKRALWGSGFGPVAIST